MLLILEDTLVIFLYRMRQVSSKCAPGNVWMLYISTKVLPVVQMCSFGLRVFLVVQRFFLGSEVLSYSTSSTWF